MPSGLESLSCEDLLALLAPQQRQIEDPKLTQVQSVTNHRPAWAPSEVDIEQPSAARMYDFYLGGSHNFRSDRELAEQYIRVLPDMPVIARAQRAVLHRAVRFLAGAGIDQFLDLGSGIPTVGAVHEVAREINPGARVVYVDSDPVAVAHTTALLDGIEGAGVVYADLRDPTAVLSNPVVGRTLDLGRPVAVLMPGARPSGRGGLHPRQPPDQLPQPRGDTGHARRLRPGRTWPHRHDPMAA